MPSRRTWLIAATVTLLAALAAAVVLQHEPPPAHQFVGTTACAGCHQQAFRDWQQYPSDFSIQSAICSFSNMNWR